ncbi:hypothetical protein DPMN_039736 [Dreissena polymorpha]|uniref:Uncharacterized protein n=1 Tax=Dreissena polymorpha TaxID=45954 RepID=A0A9D4CVT8_DREPO|nr:hypothetical protein DPMN_039736 [Dreissena polymorpha]
MMEEGPNVILRLPKIRKAIVASPEPMVWYSKKKMELELLYLEWVNRVTQCTDENQKVDDSDFIIQAIAMRNIEILIEMSQRMRHEGIDINDLSSILERIFM